MDPLKASPSLLYFAEETTVLKLVYILSVCTLYFTKCVHPVILVLFYGL